MDVENTGEKSDRKFNDLITISTILANILLLGARVCVIMCKCCIWKNIQCCYHIWVVFLHLLLLLWIFIFCFRCYSVDMLRLFFFCSCRLHCECSIFRSLFSHSQCVCHHRRRRQRESLAGHLFTQFKRHTHVIGKHLNWIWVYRMSWLIFFSVTFSRLNHTNK